MCTYMWVWKCACGCADVLVCGGVSALGTCLCFSDTGPSKVPRASCSVCIWCALAFCASRSCPLSRSSSPCQQQVCVVSDELINTCECVNMVCRVVVSYRIVHVHVHCVLYEVHVHKYWGWGEGGEKG